jgi:peptidoglycan/LPS O-acetylase OafA/YrhL
MPPALPTRPSGQQLIHGLHGLRGVAVLLVVLFHLFGAGRVSGGIDVFLAISGFLFTGLILRRATAGGFDVPAYLARLVRRLLPPVLPVLAFVLVGSLWWWPSSARLQTWREVAATLLYRENFELIGSQLAYEAAGVEASPLQHFWSLSVQGQFYLLWPFVVVGSVLVAQALGLRPVRVVALAVGAVALLSFGYAVHLHRIDQQVAYLHTGGRLWQLALPGLLALGTLGFVHRHLAVGARVVLGWLGLALILSCGFVLDGAALFPGPWALWPVLGLVLFLAAGDTGRRGSADHLLSSRAAGWLGDRSYALYLWHWPLLITALALTGRGAGDLVLSTLVLAVSLLAADLTHRLVERPTAPAERWPGARLSAAGGVVAVLLCAGTVLGAAHVVGGRQEDALRAVHDDQSLHPGAAALDPDGPPVPRAPLLVPPELASEDKPPHDAQGCWQPATDRPEFAEAVVCPEPPGSEVTDPVATVVLTGGSHGAMFEPTWRELAHEHRWRVLVMVKAGCQLTSNAGQFPTTTDHPTTASCQQWNRDALDVLRTLQPDVVFTLATTTAGEPVAERVPRGFVEVWEELGAAGIEVVAVRDIFRMSERVPDCVERHPEDPAACDTPRQATPESPLRPEMTPSNVSVVDLTDHICTATACPAVVGNVIAYFDHSHLSASYARTLAPYLDAQLRTAAPQLYAGADG